MTYSLHTLHSPPTPVRKAQTGLGRFATEVGIVLGAVLLLAWLVALLSYSPHDAAWSTTGSGLPLANRLGRFGAYVADTSYFWLGFSVWWCVAVCIRLWLSLLAQRLRGDALGPEPADVRIWNTKTAFWIGCVLLIYASTSLEWSRLYSWEARLPGHSGGALGYLTGSQSVHWLGFGWSGLVAILLGVVGAGLAFGFSWMHVAERIGGWVDRRLESYREKREMAQDLQLGQLAAREREVVLVDDFADTEGDPDHEPLAPVAQPRVKARKAEPQPTPVVIEPALAEPTVMSTRVAKERQKPLFTEMPDSKLPQVALLDAVQLRQETVAPETLEMTSRMIEKKLKDFGVEVRVVLASPGPVITRYEIEPATGVKGSQIVGLAKDLARSLSLVSIRVVETIPGKNYMALELPNAKRQSITLSEILGSQIYHEAKSLLTMGLGKDIIGNPVVADLAKMPHVLVAGTTGSGKSVGINAMILSILYKAEARDVRLLMIDPKMLEMSVYEGIPHLLAPVVTDMRQAAHGLNWCVAEMERRYKLLSKMGVRNLAGYNAKIDDAAAREEFIYNPFSLTPETPEPLQRLPHIVVVIDELADLMMVVGKKIEELIARLAQKARAAGIHLILATQRPSVDVITGLIKANIPTRISFKVSSKIDSRTILDQMGAEALLGLGDMLYMPGSGMPTRVHGAFVSDEEVHRVVSYLKTQGEPDYVEGVLEGGTVDGEDGEAGEKGGGSGEKDPMYDQAVEVVLKNRKASISLVQRHLKIGYNRAARLVEEMENAGLVSAMSGSGQREILVPARAE
ncbi:DNA translocase FtsK [Rhodoferax aquaticus]|uniref:DNA translocase FtsK n=1 Tax=Rhodoferax aquaticus TaxID=2527691 RepID=A0A515ESB2_9BURK|nr:DNA translocase FtsK [Rhodoferax aquaticus]QDL55552.1 DNA translocase FtsK [Rhodoferax aquaticus]